ncbi:MAG TPA: manganese efflux pump MntP family protein [Clostridia bacterium]|nr:manganese efflux pump MntP family protein [Clostridia bacterium]
MAIVELFLLALALSMDAFTVSICKGLSLKKARLKDMLYAGIWFGGFQGLMPVVGYFFGRFFRGYMSPFSHGIAFVLLVLIGANMIRESYQDDCCEIGASMSAKTMFLLAIATSIDALAVGISFAFLEIQIFGAALFISIITFVLSALGLKLGSVFGGKYKAKAQFLGGVVLILIGVKTLLNGLGLIF